TAEPFFSAGTRNPCSHFLANGIVSLTFYLGAEAIQLSGLVISPIRSIRSGSRPFCSRNRYPAVSMDRSRSRLALPNCPSHRCYFPWSSEHCERLTIILCWAAFGFFAVVLNYVHYLAGLLSYTAAANSPIC